MRVGWRRTNRVFIIIFPQCLIPKLRLGMDLFSFISIYYMFHRQSFECKWLFKNLKMGWKQFSSFFSFYWNIQNIQKSAHILTVQILNFHNLKNIQIRKRDVLNTQWPWLITILPGHTSPSKGNHFLLTA